MIDIEANYLGDRRQKHACGDDLSYTDLQFEVYGAMIE